MYHDTAIAILTHDDRLGLLRNIKTVERMNGESPVSVSGNEPVLPSWVPDWRYRFSSKLRLLWHRLDFTAAPPASMNERALSKDRKQLRLSGYQIDSIQALGDVRKSVHFEHNELGVNHTQCIAETILGWENVAQIQTARPYKPTSQSVKDVIW